MSRLVIDLREAQVYQDATLVLTDVTFSVEQGELVYLVGKTGSGKSSLLKVLYGDLRLIQGQGMVAGFDLRTLRPSQLPWLRRKLGIVFQDFQLLTDRTVEQNLWFVLRATGWKEKAAMKRRIEEVLDKVGLRTKSFKMPHQLSAGEQQRVVIARALLNDPELVLADEPTGNLDPETSEEIMQLLTQVSRNSRTAVLLATHDYVTLRKFPSRVLLCRDERVYDHAQI